MAQEGVTRRLAAIVAADIVGYSRLMSEDEAGTLARLKSITDELFEPRVVEYGGRVVKTTGDGILLEFPSAVDAVLCAVTVQREMIVREAEVSDDQRIQYRIGINLGDIIHDGQDIFGNGVNVASRLEGLAEPGGICISRAVFNNVKGKLDLGFADLGSQKVKNISEPISAYKVLLRPEDVGKIVGAPVTSKFGWKMISAGVTALMVLAGVGYFAWERFSPISEVSQVRLFISPFEAGSIAAEPYADAATDSLLAGFSRLKGMTIVPRSEVMEYKGIAPNLRGLASEYNATHILDGKVNLANGKITLKSRLRTISADTGPIHEEAPSGAPDQAFDLLARLKTRITAALGVTLNEVEREILETVQTRNIEAYNSFAKGHHLHFSGEWTKYGEALQMYEKAMDADPDFVDAQTALAWANYDIWRNLHSVVKPWLTAGEDAMQLINSVLTTNSDNPEALSLKALMSVQGLQWERALAEARSAVFRYPDTPVLRRTLAAVLLASGFYEEANKELTSFIEISARLTPEELRGVAILFLRAGDPKKAGTMTDQIPKEATQNFAYHMTMTELLPQLGRAEEAKEHFKRVQQVAPIATLAWFKPLFAIYKDPKVWQVYSQAVAEAGMPAWPDRFDEKHASDRLSEADIESLVAGGSYREINTIGPVGAPYERIVRNDGTFELEFVWQPRISGAWRTEADTICLKSPGAYFGREFCEPLFFDRENSTPTEQRYYQLSNFGVYSFAIERIEE